MFKFLTTLKEKLDPLVWLAGTIVLPALFLFWTYVISPKIESLQQSLKNDIIAGVSKKYDEQLLQIIKSFESLKKTDSDNNDQIRHKLLDEIDSTYYFTKTFIIDNEASRKVISLVKDTNSIPDNSLAGQSYDSTNDRAALQLGNIKSDTLQNQEPMQQFFYAAPADRVILFVWAYESGFDADIQINGGETRKLSEISDRRQEGSGSDITNLVANSPSLSPRIFAGIGENIFVITITPLYSEGPRPHRKHSQKEKELELEVSALLVIRRSPFPK